MISFLQIKYKSNDLRNMFAVINCYINYIVNAMIIINMQ